MPAQFHPFSIVFVSKQNELDIVPFYMSVVWNFWCSLLTKNIKTKSMYYLIEKLHVHGHCMVLKMSLTAFTDHFQQTNSCARQNNFSQGNLIFVSTKKFVNIHLSVPIFVPICCRFCSAQSMGGNKGRSLPYSFPWWCRGTWSNLPLPLILN